MGFSIGKFLGSASSALGAVGGFLAGGPSGASIGGSLGSAVGNYFQQDLSDKSATQAYNRNIALWNMSNRYNSPAAQMERLEAAGLNKNLVYGNGSVVGNTSGPASAATQYGVVSPKRSGLQNLISGQLLEANDATIENRRAETANILTQNKLLAAQILKVMAEVKNLGQTGISLSRENRFFDELENLIGPTSSKAGLPVAGKVGAGLLKYGSRALTYAAKYTPVGRFLNFVGR